MTFEKEVFVSFLMQDLLKRESHFLIFNLQLVTKYFAKSKKTSKIGQDQKISDFS